MIPVIIFVNLIYFLYSLIPEPYGHSCKLDQLSSPNTWVLLIYPGFIILSPRLVSKCLHHRAMRYRLIGKAALRQAFVCLDIYRAVY